jgi:protein-disulfide isomerase
MHSSVVRALGLGILVATAACGTPPPPRPPQVAPALSPPSASVAPTAVAEAPVPVPIHANDPVWGSANAKVTIVELGDFECPFCEKARVTIEELKEAYGPETLRVVWKNHPLPFHRDAAAAARAAQAIFVVSGSEAFWSAYHALFNRQRILADATSQLIERARTVQADLIPALALADKKIEEDEALAAASSITGIPAFYINGVALKGAQPYDRFKVIVEDQMKKAGELLQKGVAPDHVYDELTRAQWGKAEREPSKPDSEEPPQEPVVWRLPVGKSPVKGPADALVTIVMTTDLRCESCASIARAVGEVMELYKDKVRLVLKYSRGLGAKDSDAALQLAIEARTKKGDPGFWKAYDALLAEPNASDAALERVAAAVGLPVQAAMKAVHERKHKGVIDADEELLDDAGGGGYRPRLCFNGHEGFAYSAERLKTILDAEIAAVAARVAAGTPRAKLYDALLEQARAPSEPVRRKLPPPAKDTPGHGPSSARVTVHLFANFEAYASQRAFSDLAELEKDFPGKVRIVFRHLPLSVQPGSPLAAEAAIEAFVQKGDAGFWAMAQQMFAGRDRIDGLERPALARYGAASGLDPAKLEAALDQHTHRPAVAADLAIARQAEIRTTMIFVNDMLIAGVSAPRLRRFVRRALAESK